MEGEPIRSIEDWMISSPGDARDFLGRVLGSGTVCDKDGNRLTPQQVVEALRNTTHEQAKDMATIWRDEIEPGLSPWDQIRGSLAASFVDLGL